MQIPSLLERIFTLIDFPSGVNLMAFDNRLSNILSYFSSSIPTIFCLTDAENIISILF